MRTLYLCYFGLREPLVQTQVLPYLRELRKDDIEISLITFEAGWRGSWSKSEVLEWRRSLASDGVEWVALKYHKRPSLPATLFDVVAGVARILKLTRKKRIDILHARSHVPALMGAIAKLFLDVKLVFDIRGFMPEEYVDAGVWKPKGLLFRMTKRVETWLIDSADGFVVLTEKAKSILFPDATDVDSRGRPIEVIPCCVDLKRFDDNKSVPVRGMDEGSKVWAYVGALGGWYLTDRMADFLAFLGRKQQNVKALILTQSSENLLSDRLIKLGFQQSDYLIRKVSPAEIPQYLCAAHIGISFIKPCFSKMSSSPTKIAEYLAAGLPVLSNSGVGDVDEVIRRERVGVIMNGFNEDHYDAALIEMNELMCDPDLIARCRRIAHLYFDLETVGGVKYRNLYRNLVN